MQAKTAAANFKLQLGLVASMVFTNSMGPSAHSRSKRPTIGKNFWSSAEEGACVIMSLGLYSRGTFFMVYAPFASCS